MIKLVNVNLFEREEFGLKDVNFSLGHKDRVHCNLEDKDQLNSLFGILEGRYRPESGRVFYDRLKPHTQSDRLLMGGKVYDVTAEKYWVLSQEVLFFGGEKRYKRSFLEQLKCRSLRHFPVYKLKGDDRLKFTLLALLFQPKGLILISDLLTAKLDEDMLEILRLLHCQSGCIIVYASCGDEAKERIDWLTGERPLRQLAPPWDQREEPNLNQREELSADLREEQNEPSIGQEEDKSVDPKDE
ncbi:MAG: hypothetical protein QNL04_02900 [SAR324 cluster bacterium]|nr:hypothetical protein [SAR324 cluster bacterium]